MSAFTLSNSPRKLPVSRAVFLSLKNAVLGRDYELSVAFISSSRMRELNQTYRGKDTPTDILSFPLTKKSGEIFFCLAEVKKQAPLFDQPYENFLKFLLIHGLLHLKGFDHGSKMERQEIKFRKQFGM